MCEWSHGDCCWLCQGSVIWAIPLWHGQLSLKHVSCCIVLRQGHMAWLSVDYAEPDNLILFTKNPLGSHIFLYAC